MKIKNELTSKNAPKNVSGIGLPEPLEASITRVDVWLASPLHLLIKHTNKQQIKTL